MTALADALTAAQAKALAALEKAYVRGALDLDQFQSQMEMIGCTDKVDQDLLIASLDTLRQYGQTEPAYTEKRQTEKPTQAQISYVEKLAGEHGYQVPDLTGATRAQASEVISAMQKGTYDPAKWPDIPF